MPMSNDPTMPRKPVLELVVGDLVDLENDPHADKGNHPEFEFELQEIESIEVETADCVAVYFTSGLCVGFPMSHTLPVGTPA